LADWVKRQSKPSPFVARQTKPIAPNEAIGKIGKAPNEANGHPPAPNEPIGKLGKAPNEANDPPRAPNEPIGKLGKAPNEANGLTRAPNEPKRAERTQGLVSGPSRRTMAIAPDEPENRFIGHARNRWGLEREIGMISSEPWGEGFAAIASHRKAEEK
jgi:hypothetical protein